MNKKSLLLPMSFFYFLSGVYAQEIKIKDWHNVEQIVKSISPEFNMDTGRTMKLTVEKISKEDSANFLKYSGVKLGNDFYSLSKTKGKISDPAKRAEWQADFDSGTYKWNIKNLFTDVDSAELHLGNSKAQADTLFIKIIRKESTDAAGNTIGTKNVAISFIPAIGVGTNLVKAELDNVIKPPVLNPHTRWAVVYDYTKFDPVAVWKRTNKFASSANGSNNPPDKDGAKSKSIETSSLPANDYNDHLYKVRHSKRLSPHVGRDLLISVINYHPYQDSFAVAIDYNDQFLENGALFTSTFSALKQNTPVNSSGASSTTSGEGQNGTPEINNRKNYVEVFTTLKNDLKKYYVSKYDQEHLSIAETENGISYINMKLTEYLQISDFTGNGIIKRGEELADSVKKDTSVKLADYFAIVHEAADWYAKIINYNRFDSKSILVQNKDVMNITLNRYRGGKLVTTPNEALRSYHTAGGVKIDFSLGLYGSNLLDKLYTTKSVQTYDTSYFTRANGIPYADSIRGIDTVQRKQIIRDELGKFDIGPAVLMHGYWRTGRDLNVSGTFGLSINQSANIRYLLGVSLLAGKDNRWIVTGGCAFGKTKDLSSSYQENQIIDPLTENNGAVPTKDVMRSAWFLSVSWNFAGFTIGS